MFFCIFVIVHDLGASFGIARGAQYVLFVLSAMTLGLPSAFRAILDQHGVQIPR